VFAGKLEELLAAAHALRLDGAPAGVANLLQALRMSRRMGRCWRSVPDLRDCAESALPIRVHSRL
jgi:hypothetical protein